MNPDGVISPSLNSLIVCFISGKIHFLGVPYVEELVYIFGHLNTPIRSIKHNV